MHDDFRTRVNVSFNSFVSNRAIKFFLKFRKKIINKITLSNTNLYASDLSGKLSKLLKILKVIPTYMFIICNSCFILFVFVHLGHYECVVNCSYLA